MSVKRTVELVKTDIQRSSDGVLYRVVKLTNSVEPSIGSLLSTNEIKDYIRRPGWTVIIKEVRA